MMANWKDKQFKEYLEEIYKREKNNSNNTSGDAAYFFSIRMKLIEQIINELFPESEQDNSDRDE